MMNIPIDWLLKDDPWIEYRTRLDLLGQPEDDPQVRLAFQSLMAYPLVQNLVAELSGWPGTVISSHKSAGQPFHKLTFLGSPRLTTNDPGEGTITARILDHQA